MIQKFRMLTFVKVSNDLPPQMAHFKKGFLGIVCGSYSQIYGGKNISNYSIYVVEGGKVVNQVSWYPESVLTEIKMQDRLQAERMIEEYNLKVKIAP